MTQSETLKEWIIQDPFKNKELNQWVIDKITSIEDQHKLSSFSLDKKAAHKKRYSFLSVLRVTSPEDLGGRPRLKLTGPWLKRNVKLNNGYQLWKHKNYDIAAFNSGRTQCCADSDPGHGIQCLFVPWILDTGSQTHIYEMLVTLFWVESMVLKHVNVYYLLTQWQLQWDWQIMQYKASPGFSIFILGNLHTVQLTWRIFRRSLHMPPSACFSSCRIQAGLMKPRPRGRRPPTLWLGRQMGPPLCWPSWRPSWWAGACPTPLCAELHSQQRGVHTPLRKRRLLCRGRLGCQIGLELWWPSWRPSWWAGLPDSSLCWVTYSAKRGPYFVEEEATAVKRPLNRATALMIFMEAITMSWCLPDSSLCAELHLDTQQRGVHTLLRKRRLVCRGHQMGPPLWWSSWRPSWWADACPTPPAAPADEPAERRKALRTSWGSWSCRCSTRPVRSSTSTKRHSAWENHMAGACA